jgi:hypothetical protein
MGAASAALTLIAGLLCGDLGPVALWARAMAIMCAAALPVAGGIPAPSATPLDWRPRTNQVSPLAVAFVS